MTIAQQFLAFAFECGALKFGEFTLKSGQQSPYFFDTGVFASGDTLERLGWFYASTIATSIADAKIECDLLYGSAYKGIPLACTTAICLHRDFHIDKGFAFNRKETKDHGEGGNIVGTSLQGRVLIIDDVISAGITIHESVALIRHYGAEPAGIVIAFDREEPDSTDTKMTTRQRITDELELTILSIAKYSDLIQMFENQTNDNAQELLKKLLAYHNPMRG